MFIYKLYTYCLADRDVFVHIGQQPRLHVTPEHLNLVAVSATTQQILPIGRDVELAGMSSRRLIADSR